METLVLRELHTSCLVSPVLSIVYYSGTSVTNNEPIFIHYY